jgi:hypothetical protein
VAKKPVPAVVAANEGAERALLETTGFAAVPATAGAVKVAVPLVRPERFNNPAVVPTMPAVTEALPVRAVNVAADPATVPVNVGEASGAAPSVL